MEHIDDFHRIDEKEILRDEPGYSLVQNTPKKGLILDAGAGAGKYARILHNAERTIICLDIKRPKRRDPDYQYILADIEYLPFKKELFESIYCLSVIQLIKNDQAIFIEFRRILKPGGILLLTLPTKYSMFHLLRELELFFNVYQNPEFNIPHHHYYSKRKIKQLSSNYFSIVKIKGYSFNFFPRLLGFLWNLLKKSYFVRVKDRKLEENVKIYQRVDTLPKEHHRHYFFYRLDDAFSQIFGDFEYHYIVILKGI